MGELCLLVCPLLVRLDRRALQCQYPCLFQCQCPFPCLCLCLFQCPFLTPSLFPTLCQILFLCLFLFPFPILCLCQCTTTEMRTSPAASSLLFLSLRLLSPLF